MPELTTVVTELETVKGALHGDLITKFAKADATAGTALLKWVKAIKTEGLLKVADFPANWSLAHPVCQFFLARFAEGASPTNARILSSTKNERKEWSEDKKKVFQSLMRTQMNRYSRMRSAVVGALTGVVNTSNPKAQGNKPAYSSDERAVVGAIAIQSMFGAVKEPTQHDVQCAMFWTKTIDTFISELGTADMKKAHGKAVAGKLKAGISIKKKD